MLITIDYKMYVTPPGSGCVVKVKAGQGKTKNGDKSINGKIPVYLDNGTKMICTPANIEIIGYYD